MERSRSYLLRIIGLVFVALGTLGAFLPVMPTVVFLIVALWCFARSSERLYQWLYYHRTYGPLLRDWETHRVIPITAKVMAITSMLVSLACMLWAGVDVKWLALAAIFMACGAGYILSKPSHLTNNRDG